MKNSIIKYLKELDFSDNEINIYIALTELGESVASKVAKKADLPRTTVIGILEKLKKNNFLSTHHYRGSTYYWIESPKAIKNVFLNKVKIAEELDKYLIKLYRSEADFPFAKIYDTKTSIKLFIEKTINQVPKNTIFYTIDAPNQGNYQKIFSDNFGEVLIGLKNKKGISTKTLIPFGHYKSIKPEKITCQSIEIREMPQEISFHSSIWIIEDMLVHFSGKYPFLVAINHKIITEGFRSLYQYFWSISFKK